MDKKATLFLGWLEVRPGGFEPPTFWSVARHSIQLSYGRIILFLWVAGVQGIEPQPSEPEPDVLPLDDTPIKSLEKGREFKQFLLVAKRIK